MVEAVGCLSSVYVGNEGCYVLISTEDIKLHPGGLVA